MMQNLTAIPTGDPVFVRAMLPLSTSGLREAAP